MAASKLRNASEKLAFWFLASSDYIFLYSATMLVFGGLGYYFLAHVSITRAYEIHYEMILALQDPFTLLKTPVLKIFAVVDAISAYLILPSIFSIILTRAESAYQETIELQGRVYASFLELYRSNKPEAANGEIQKLAKQSTREYIKKLGEPKDNTKKDSPSPAQGGGSGQTNRHSLRFRTWLAEGKAAVEESYPVLLFALTLIVISLAAFVAESQNLQTILVYGMTNQNWWGVVTGIVIHAPIFTFHLLPNIIGLMLATMLYAILFHANTFERARRSSVVFCVLSMYAALLGNAALYFMLAPGQIDFGMSGVVLAMGGLDLALSVVGLSKASRANKIAKRIAHISRWKKGPFDRYETLNMMAYFFIALLFFPAFQPMTVVAGQFIFVSGVSVHLMAFGVGLAAGIPYFASLKARRYEFGSPDQNVFPEQTEVRTLKVR